MPLFAGKGYPHLHKRGSSALCVGGFHAKQPATGSALFRSCRHCHLCLQGRNHEGGLRRHGPRSTRSRRGRVRVGNHIGRQRSPTTLPRTLQTSFQRGGMRTRLFVGAGCAHWRPRFDGAVRTCRRRPCAQPSRNDPPSAHGTTVYTAGLVPVGPCALCFSAIVGRAHW